MFARKSDLEHLERKFDIFVKSLDTRFEVYKNAADVRYDLNQQEIKLVREGINATQDILASVVLELLADQSVFDRVSGRVRYSMNNKKEE